MTLFELITNTLRETFARRRKKASGPAIKLTTSGSGGVWPGVNLDDTSALLDLMDGLDDPAVDGARRSDSKVK